MFAIETRNLTKRYSLGWLRKRPVAALENLSLEIVEREIFGIIGHNGAGKSTTIKLLLRLIFPTGGDARVLGQAPGDPATARQIGYLPEAPYFYDYLTPRELLHYYGSLSGLHGPRLSSQVAWALERLGVGDYADRALRRCSKGMVQRVGLAQAIVHQPRLVILDEPMSGLDPSGRREVRDLIRDLSASGATVLFSTHILADAEDLCDRVAILHRGRLRGIRRPTEWLHAPDSTVEIVFVGSGIETRTLCRKADLWTTLEKLRQAGAEILALNSQHLRLEEIYAEETADESSAAALGTQS
jgi:ABC-2 type transport system ATP-binding protein